MPAPHGSIRASHHDQTVTFQVEGWGKMTHSLPMRQFTDRAIAGGATVIRVDLGRCTYMDSTFIGTLLFLKRAMDRCGQGKFSLVSPSPECCELLQKMKMKDLFPTGMGPATLPGEWVELRCADEDGGAMQQNVVEAHEELASLPGAAGEPFRWAAKRCREELEEKKSNP